MDNKTAVDEIVEKRRDSLGGMISILEEIQAQFGYLPEDALREVAATTGRSLTDIYGVATFYRYFSLKPKGKHIIVACMGTACHVRGASRIVDELERQLGIKPGETTADDEVTLETVNCLGACALGPIVVADGRYFTNVNTGKVKKIIQDTRAGLVNAAASGDESIFPINAACPRCGHSLMDESRKIDQLPSVHIIGNMNGSRGKVKIKIWLSCLYGSHAVAMEPEIPMKSTMSLQCPHCKESLDSGMECSACGAAMAAMAVKGGATVYVCSRRGCREHALDLNEK